MDEPRRRERHRLLQRQQMPAYAVSVEGADWSVSSRSRPIGGLNASGTRMDSDSGDVFISLNFIYFKIIWLFVSSPI